MVPKLAFRVDQFAHIDDYYLDSADSDFEETGYAWKYARPHLCIDDTRFDPDREEAPLTYPDDLAFCTPTPHGTVIQFEIMTYAGLVPLPDGETEVLFGTFSALEAAGAVKMIPAVETLRNYLKGCR